MTDKRIVVHKDGAEGAIHIDRLTGAVLTPGDERPDWADGLAVAMLVERTGYYEQRLGAQLTEDVRSPQMLTMQDLEWVGVDAEGDEVHVEADPEFRMDTLAQLLGVDRADYDDENNFKKALSKVEVAHTYVTHPADEQSLRDVEGRGFEDIEKDAATG